MTEDEAFVAALKVQSADSTSYFAEVLAGSPMEFWRSGVLDDMDGFSVVAACTYFAVRGGVVVMREETSTEAAERADAEAGSCYG